MIWEPGAARDLPEDQLKQWEDRIDRAEQVRKQYESTWENALKRYTETKADTKDVNPLLEVRHVESKKAQLFYQTPEVQLHPIDPQIPEIPTDPLLPLRQKVLNDRLGPDGTDVKRTVHEALFDCLAPSGLLCTEIGYDVRLAPAPPDPTTGQPMVGPDGQPVEQVPIWGQAYWERVTPKKVLIPSEWRSTRYDKAPWLGIGPLTMPLARAKREFQLPEDFTASSLRDDAVFEHREQSIGQSQGEPVCEYYKVWLRAEVFDETVINPELYRELIFIKGLDHAATYRDSPFQSVDEMGQLTTDSMRGNPIHLGTLRDLSDSAYIASDLALMEQLSSELVKYRTGLVRNRVARTPFNLIDPDGFPAEEIDKIKAGEKNIFTKPGQLISGQPAPIQAANPGQEPRDNFAAQDIIERDIEKAMAQSANTSGQLQQQKRTATEVRAAQGGSNARSEAEKDRLREWFIAGVRKFDAVLQRTMTPQELVKILGQQGATLWDQWRSLSGCYVYKILPDSGVHVDAQQYRAQVLEMYNMLRKDPQVAPAELLKPVARAFNLDPAKTVLPQAPEQGPDPMKTSFAFKGEDFLGPQAEIVLMICAQMGIAIPADAIQRLEAQKGVLMATGQLGPDGKPPTPVGDPSAKHGGSAGKTEPVNQHQRERTGGMQGVGVQ